MQPEHGESGPAPLDGNPQLTPDEVHRLRRLLLEADRTTWAAKKLRVLIPLGVSLVVGLFQIWSWVEKHLTIKP